MMEGSLLLGEERRKKVEVNIIPLVCLGAVLIAAHLSQSGQCTLRTDFQSNIVLDKPANAWVRGTACNQRLIPPPLPYTAIKGQLL